jgi:hypothetical protein
MLSSSLHSVSSTTAVPAVLICDHTDEYSVCSSVTLITKESGSISDTEDIASVEKSAKPVMPKIMYQLLHVVKGSCSQFNPIQTILKSSITERCKVQNCLKRMRLIFEVTLFFISQNGTTELQDINQMAVVIGKRKKLGCLVHPRDDNLRIFPREVRGILTLVFLQYCTDMMDHTCLLEKLNTPPTSQKLTFEVSYTYEFCYILMEKIVKSVPVGEEGSCETCTSEAFCKDLEIVGIVLRSTINVLNEIDMDGAQLVSRLRDLYHHLLSMKERSQYIVSCDLKRFIALTIPAETVIS